MLAPGNTSPCHHSLHLFAKRRESQHAGIAQQLSDRALRGYRGIGAALAGLAALITSAGFGAYWGSLHGPAHKQYSAVDEGKPASEAYQGVSKSLGDIALIPKPVERAIANPSPYTGQDHEKRDLAAQESMAVWAFYMAIFAGASTFVTFIGTFLIWRQVSLTRKAVEDTGKATQAMVDSNRITQKAESGYLVPSSEISELGISKRIFTISLINVGRSHATLMHSCVFVCKKTPHDFSKNIGARYFPGELVNIPPSSDYSLISFNVERDDYFFCGWARYIDIFDQTRDVFFAYYKPFGDELYHHYTAPALMDWLEEDCIRVCAKYK